MANYSHLTTNPDPLKLKGGYKDEMLFCPVADFATIAAPVASATLGSSVTIGTAHTFTGTNGFYSWETKKASVTGKVSSVGDAGAKLPQYTYEGIVLGDSASTQEQMQRQLNGKNIFLFKDATCGAGQYIQLGDECTQPEASVDADFKTNAEGMKEWKVTLVVTAARYFYTGAVVKSTAA